MRSVAENGNLTEEGLQTNGQVADDKGRFVVEVVKRTGIYGRKFDMEGNEDRRDQNRGQFQVNPGGLEQLLAF